MKTNEEILKEHQKECKFHRCVHYSELMDKARAEKEPSRLDKDVCIGCKKSTITGIKTYFNIHGTCYARIRCVKSILDGGTLEDNVKYINEIKNEEFEKGKIQGREEALAEQKKEENFEVSCSCIRCDKPVTIGFCDDHDYEFRIENKQCRTELEALKKENEELKEKLRGEAEHTNQKRKEVFDEIEEKINLHVLDQDAVYSISVNDWCSLKRKLLGEPKANELPKSSAIFEG